MRGRFRESEPGAKPPQPIRFADAALANPPFTARGERWSGSEAETNPFNEATCPRISRCRCVTFVTSAVVNSQ